MAAGGENLITISFYNGGGRMVKTPKRPTIRCKSRKKQDFLRHSFFPKDYILEKENAHIPSQLLDSFFSIGITFQNKEKYLTQYNYSILQLEYFFPN